MTAEQAMPSSFLHSCWFCVLLTVAAGCGNRNSNLPARRALDNLRQKLALQSMNMHDSYQIMLSANNYNKFEGPDHRSKWFASLSMMLDAVASKNTVTASQVADVLGNPSEVHQLGGNRLVILYYFSGSSGRENSALYVPIEPTGNMGKMWINSRQVIKAHLLKEKGDATGE